MEVVEASKAEIGVKPACEALGLSRATYYRHKAPPGNAVDLSGRSERKIL
jgi:hypothetical protein